jgi:hypothetical protein
MKTVNGKEKLFVMLMCIALVLPLAPIGAQDSDNFWSDAASSDKNNSDNTEAAVPEAAAETVAPKAAAETTAPKTGGQTPSPKKPKVQGAGSVTAIINKLIGSISQIGAMFGKSTGTRIGGTSVSAIVMLVVAKLIQDRGPSWLKWLLYLSGGTMVAGSGANITQMIMQFLS